MLKLVLVLCALAAVAWSAEIRGKETTIRTDNVNVDEVLRNDRLLNHYFKCLVEGGKCSPEGAALKKTLPDALKYGCKDCTEKDRVDSEKVIRFLIDNKPSMWKKLEEKYDPKGEYKAKYRGEAQKHGIKV